MQTDKNASGGGSGMPADAMGSKATGAADAEGTEREQQRAQKRHEELVAYRERLEVEQAPQDQQTGRATLRIQVTEHPERFEVTRNHDEAVISKRDLTGDMAPGKHHEFVERSVEIPLYGAGSEVVVHKVSEPYTAASLDAQQITDKQVFETRLKEERIVEEVPTSSDSALSVREIEEGYDVGERRMRQEREAHAGRTGGTGAMGSGESRQSREGRGGAMEGSQEETPDMGARSRAEEAGTETEQKGKSKEKGRWWF